MAKSNSLRDRLLANSKQAIDSARSATPGVSSQSGAVWLPVAEILADPDQPRIHLDDGAMTRLVESIRAIGLVEPIVVEPLRSDERVGGKRFRCISGHRRLKAHEILGLPEIHATIARATLDASRRFVHEIAANEAREEHTDFERAQFMTRLFADRLRAEKSEAHDALDRVRKIVNRAFNELDRNGAFGAESTRAVEACETALREIGERRNLRWYHRWGLPLLALTGAPRAAAINGLDARRALALGKVVARGEALGVAETDVDELARRIAERLQAHDVPHREVVAFTRELIETIEIEKAITGRVNAIVDRFVGGAVVERTETRSRSSRRSAHSEEGGATPPDVVALRERVEGLLARWSATIPPRDRGVRRSAAVPIADLVATASASSGREAERLVRALVAADRALAAFLTARDEGNEEGSGFPQ
jgi:ParB/RepB/Spo0J family partition protein